MTAKHIGDSRSSALGGDVLGYISDTHLINGVGTLNVKAAADAGMTPRELSWMSFGPLYHFFGIIERGVGTHGKHRSNVRTLGNADELIGLVTNLTEKRSGGSDSVA